jgi:hypothetical protein
MNHMLQVPCTPLSNFFSCSHDHIAICSLHLCMHRTCTSLRVHPTPHLCMHTPMHIHIYLYLHRCMHTPMHTVTPIHLSLSLSLSLSFRDCLVRSPICTLCTGVDAFEWQLGVLPLHGRCVLRRWLHVLPSRHHVPQRRLRMVSDDNVRRGKRHGNPPWCGRWRPRSVQDRRAPNILNDEEERDNSGGLCIDWLRTVCC